MLTKFMQKIFKIYLDSNLVHHITDYININRNKAVIKVELVSQDLLKCNFSPLQFRCKSCFRVSCKTVYPIDDPDFKQFLSLR